MRLFYEKGNIDINMVSSGLYGLCIEKSELLRDFIQELYLQTAGDGGTLYLTDGAKNVRFDREVTVVFNPFAINVNEKKILSKLYADMDAIAKQELYVELQAINTMVVSAFDEINMKIQYSIDYGLSLDFQQLLKIYNVRLDEQETELSERIANYIHLAHNILNIKVFVFVQLKGYLSNEEIELLQETIQLEGVFVLLIESSFRNVLGMKWWIIDKDSCIIEL